MDETSKFRNEPSDQLKDVLRATERINNFDFNKMISDYDTSARHEKQWKDIQNKWVKHGRKYNETIKKMKIRREEEYQDKKRKWKERLVTKEKLWLTALESSNQKKMEDRNQLLQALVQREREAKVKVERHQEAIEFERWASAEKTDNKIARFIELNTKEKQNLHEQVVRKNEWIAKKHEKNMEILHAQMEQLEKEAQEKAFEKYSAIYWHRIENEKWARKKKRKEEMKSTAKQYRWEELQELQKKRRKEILGKISSMVKTKKEYEKKKAEELERIKDERLRLFETCYRHKEEWYEEQMKRRESILDDEIAIFSRGINKDDINEKQRIQANMKTIQAQIALQDNWADFRRQMHRLKEGSILTWTPNERLKLYKDKKKEEEELEKKRKEEELEKKKKGIN